MRLPEALRATLGAEVADSRPLHGGDLSEVRLAHLDDGRRVVLKRGPVVAAEARMLQALAHAGADVPAVLGVAGDLLCLEHLDETAPDPAGWARLGTMLARLHGAPGPAEYGWHEDHAFGPLPIANTPLPDWPAFWAARRLRPFLPDLPADLAARVETLAARLADLLPARPKPALLHGDLWSGNLLFTADRACLIDPASYRGDAEVDLAMLHLFGRPGAGFAEAYGPLPPGTAARRPVYQLWPALVHLRLFGAGYRGMVERLLADAGA